MYRCKLCGKIFSSKREAKNHIKSEHKKEWKHSGINGTWVNRSSVSSFLEKVKEQPKKEEVKKKSLIGKIFSFFKKEPVHK